MSDTEESVADKTESRSSRRISISGVLALLISLASLSATAYLWYQLTIRNAGLLSQSIPGQVQALRNQLNALSESDKQDKQSIEDLAKTQKILEEATRKAYADISRKRSGWAISEIEQLLIIANQRLQLSQDYETTVIALQAADHRLHALADPSLTPVRKLLAKEINELQSSDRTDISGLSLRLSGLIDNVESLPVSLQFTYQPTEVNGSTEAAGTETKPKEKDSGFWSEFLHDIKGLVQTRHNVESYKPLLMPKQQYFLRENLKLLLLGAQQALLRNDNDVYLHNLKSAKQWVDQYFDTNTQAIRHLKSELDALSSTKLIRKTPDISASLTLLRKLTRENGSQ
ncbi:MAG: uroporphyrinogen-III C-methyltransferase [Acidiferrobacterales bacterium]